MDTRSKIVGPDHPQLPGALVTGFFDPVTVEHVRRLKHIREGWGAVTVLLRDPPDPILDARARAEVLAALDVVDYVLLPQERALSVEVERRQGYFVFREDDADRVRFHRLSDRIHERHGSPAR